MKILTRLSKEGSSAEEPLNIPLSDYSSDEGDTSTSSSEDEAGKDSMAELEGPCCSSLRVPPSSPVLPQKFKGNKKGKKSQNRTPNKPFRRRSRNAHRIVLDIPTAEPASDFFDYTSDEDSSPFGGGYSAGHHHPYHQTAVSDTENTIKTSFRRRHRFRQSDRIKKLTMLGCETQYLMPPELIVRSATSRYLSEEEDDKNRMVMSIIKEFPPISKERSWQGFNRATAERNRAELMKPMSPDHIFAHLSFKRSIWTGTHSDGYVNETAITINPRPLSWGVPPVLVKSTHYDNEALLTACSQKLAAWKDEKRSLKEKHHKSLSRLAAKDKENRSGVSAGGAMSSSRGMKLQLGDNANGKQKQGTTADKKLSDSSEGSGIAKVRRKTRSTLNKIAEKAEIITHLSRSARSGQSRRMAVAAAASLLSSSGSPRKATSTGNLLGPVSGSQQQLLVSSQSLKTPLHGNKFKTGGIVVTAAQPLHSRQQRSKTGGHLRAVRTPSNSNINQQQSSSTSPTKLPTTTTIDIQLTTLCSETESEKNVKIVSGTQAQQQQQQQQRKHRKKHHRGGIGGNRDKSASTGGGRAPI